MPLSIRPSAARRTNPGAALLQAEMAALVADKAVAKAGNRIAEAVEAKKRAAYSFVLQELDSLLAHGRVPVLTMRGVLVVEMKKLEAALHDALAANWAEQASTAHSNETTAPVGA